MAEPPCNLDQERWKAISPYLDRALDLEDDERAQWLAELRVENPAMAETLAPLLAEYRLVVADGFLEDGSLTPRQPETLAGYAIGAYRLVEPIGQGGMGTVWLAERSDGRFEGRVAVKLLNLSLMGPSPSRGEERFTREGHLLARLTHPNIARLIDAGLTPNGQPYLVLEYIDGLPIDRYCDEKALGVEARLRLFLDVLAAVAHAHANLVVHRDLKPSNVLVSSDGRVKLLDFGIAKLLQADDAHALTREGSAVLTPEFAAPEQVTGRQVTTSTDVYSLGVLLYLLLGGQHPVGSGLKSPADLVKAIVDTDPPRLSDAVTDSKTEVPTSLEDNAARRATTPDRLRRLLRGDLDTIVAKALKKSADERYASVTALADDVRRYLARQPISARPDTLAYRTAKFVRRQARGVAAGVCVALLIAGLVAYYGARLAAERDRARLEAQKSAKVSELMTELLTGADPYRDRPDPTVRDVLDAGAARLRTELADQPELLAEMLTAIGRVYQRLEVHDQAQPLLEQALAIGRALPGPEHPRVAQTLNDFGVLRRKKGELAASAQLLEEALAMRRRLLGPRHKDLAVTISELGRVLDDLGQSERAEVLAREALAMRHALLGDQHRETATSMGDLGLLLRQRGDLKEAERLLRQSFEISRRALGDRHPNVYTAASNLGLVIGDLGDHAASEVLFRQALAMESAVHGTEHPTLANTLNNLAWPLRELGKYDEALATQEKAVRLAVGATGEESRVVAHYRFNLARIHVARGDAAAAERLLRQSLSVRLRVFGRDDWRVGMTASLLGAALTRLGQYDEAESLLLDAQRLLKDVPGPQGREAKATVTRLAALYAASGRRPASTKPAALVATRSGSGS